MRGMGERLLRKERSRYLSTYLGAWYIPSQVPIDMAGLSASSAQHTSCLLTLAVAAAVAAIIVISHHHHHRPDYRQRTSPPPLAVSCTPPACMYRRIPHCTLHIAQLHRSSRPSAPSLLPYLPLPSWPSVQGPWPTDSLPVECASDQVKCTWTGRLHAFIVQSQIAAASAPRSAARAQRAWRKTMVRWSSRLSKSSVDQLTLTALSPAYRHPSLHGTSHTVPASHPPMTPLAALPSSASLLRLCRRRQTALCCCFSASATASASASASATASACASSSSSYSSPLFPLLLLLLLLLPSPSPSPSAPAPAPSLPLLPHSPPSLPACT
jgi:hypothetical protein